MTSPALLANLAAAAPIRGVLAALGLLLASTAAAQDGGYFSGIRLSNGDKAWSFAAPGLKLGQSLEFARPSADIGSTAFTGYRFASGFAVGAAVNTDNGGLNSNTGLGLKLDGLRFSESKATVNVDVVSAFNWRNSLSVFGKVGVGRSDQRATPEWVSPVANALDRTAISYGMGVRYDFTPSLGLKFEVSRGTRFGWDRLRTDVDPDAINVGIRWSF